jgi:hypothetical protein
MQSTFMLCTARCAAATLRRHVAPDMQQPRRLLQLAVPYLRASASCFEAVLAPLHPRSPFPELSPPLLPASAERSYLRGRPTCVKGLWPWRS